MNNIPFNYPANTGKEIQYIGNAVAGGKICGDGAYTKLVNQWFHDIYNVNGLLVHSGTAALEMGALLFDVQPGDEVIMPSYTFVSTANAFVLRGAVPVFVDIRADTLNLDETKIEEAVTPKTKAIVPVHYAGVGCEMDAIMQIAEKYNLKVMEDAAQGFDAFYKNKRLGTIGNLGAVSFHETKNIVCGEGGALFINDASLTERAEIIREKGTNRSRFFRGQVDKYTWVDIGSSYLPGDISAAYLYAQLEEHQQIMAQRMNIWNKYNLFFAAYEKAGIIRRPVFPQHCRHNAHMYYILFNSLAERTSFIACLKEHNINSVFHYIPLHSSPAGIQYCKTPAELSITDKVSDCLVRLPLFYNLTNEQQAYIFDIISKFMKEKYRV